MKAIAEQHFYLGVDRAEIIRSPASDSFIHFGGEPQRKCFAGGVGDASVNHGGGSFGWWGVGGRIL